MWQFRSHLGDLGDPRLHFFGLLVVLILLLAGIFPDFDSPPCPSCPGHGESVRDCLCYHAPTAGDSVRR